MEDQGLGYGLSRDSYPKQYLSLLTNDKKSLLQKTQERIKNFKEARNPILHAVKIRLSLQNK